jgi:hypothetical protein
VKYGRIEHQMFLKAIMKAHENILKAFDWAWCVKTLIAYKKQRF